MKDQIRSIDFCYPKMIGTSQAIQSVFEMIKCVAGHPSTVLIIGETGTGKELVARAIHEASSRKNHAMVTVNCAAIPSNLIESELFGHERGSFTGALDRRIGKFELANNGTLFLDEIGEMPLELQSKLLRAIQEREIERIGGKQSIKINVRIIAATNRDLEKEIRNGNFRRDLYYRLNVFPIVMPLLRDRREDILDLATFFLDKYSGAFNKRINGFSVRAQQYLINYHWPGNIRELEHTIERSLLLANGNVIKEVYIPGPAINEPTGPGEFSFKTIADNERELIIQTLLRCGAKLSGVGGAAKKLGVPVSTLNSKMKKLGITKTEMLRNTVFSENLKKVS